jgi:hypothetical protein
MKLIAGRARCRLSSSAALVDELQQFGGAGRTGEGLDFIALANRSIDRPRNYQPISALWGAWTRRLLGQARRCPSRLGPRENREWRWRESNPLNRPYSRAPSLQPSIFGPRVPGRGHRGPLGAADLSPRPRGIS